MTVFKEAMLWSGNIISHHFMALWIVKNARLGIAGAGENPNGNPPFGRIANNYRKSYMSGEFEYMVIEAASRIAKEGAFIIPQMSAPFVYSGTEDHRWLQEGRARTFEKRTGILLEFNQGIDTAYYKNDWHCTAPICEIVCCDFAGTDTSAA